MVNAILEKISPANANISARFLQFDHKQLRNMELYNQTTPPSYQLSNIAVRIHFLYGTNDFMASYFVRNPHNK